MPEGETVIDRIVEIRVALGSARKPLPLRAFADLIEQTTGFRYDPSTLSRIETGEREIALPDVERIAAVDPKGRGPAWLAGWARGEDPPGLVRARELSEGPPPAPPQAEGTAARLRVERGEQRRGGKANGR